MSAKPLILVVDINPAEGQTLLGVLRSAPYEAVLVDSPDDALDYVDTVDLVVSGVGPDDPRGKELLENWHMRRPDTPYLLISEPNGSAVTEEAMQLGAVDCIAKPFDSDELLMRIAAKIAPNLSKKPTGGDEPSDRLEHSIGDGRSSAPVIEIPPGTTLEDLERAAIEQALKQHQGNRTHAAKSLGISVRTLQRKLKAWRGASAPSVAESRGDARPSSRTWSKENSTARSNPIRPRVAAKA